MHLGDPRPLFHIRPAWPDVRVASVWLPRLPLRVVVLRHPAWAGRPSVLSAAPGERKVVQLCSPEAERAGIRLGLPLREVLALCPEAIVVRPDPARVATVLDEVLARLQSVSPAVEATDEELFLDLRGLEALYRNDLRVLEGAIGAAVPSLLRPRIGVADGKFAASVAARVATPSRAHVVPADKTARFLAPLPIRYLPFAPDALQRLDLLGLRRIGDLAALPFATVQAQFGRLGARAWRLAKGEDDEAIVPRPYRPAVRASLRFEDPLASVDAVMANLDRLLGRAFADPTLRGPPGPAACAAHRRDLLGAALHLQGGALESRCRSSGVEEQAGAAERPAAGAARGAWPRAAGPGGRGSETTRPVRGSHRQGRGRLAPAPDRRGGASVARALRPRAALPRRGDGAVVSNPRASLGARGRRRRGRGVAHVRCAAMR